jgi:hypothetical protein
MEEFAFVAVGALFLGAVGTDLLVGFSVWMRRERGESEFGQESSNQNQ